jgi:hypothetical protein
MPHLGVEDLRNHPMILSDLVSAPDVGPIAGPGRQYGPEGRRNVKLASPDEDEMSTNWLAAIGVTAAVASGIGALSAVLIQLRIFNKQLTVQIYSDYTKRYQEIIVRLPEDINEMDFDLASRPDYDAVMRGLRTYFDLCFEEWDLHERKLISKGIWGIWSGGIGTALSKPAFIQAWSVVDRSSDYGGEFEAFIARSIATASSKLSAAMRSADSQPNADPQASY